MSKKDWGKKRTCESCGARFYDLGRDPPTCPKCTTQVREGGPRSTSGTAPPVSESQAKEAVVANKDLAALDMEENADDENVAEQNGEALIENVRDMSGHTGEPGEVVDGDEDKGENKN